MAAGQDSHFFLSRVSQGLRPIILAHKSLERKWESVPAINKKKKTRIERSFLLYLSSIIILFSFLFISRDMIHVTIFFSFYCWPSAWGWLNGQQKENEDVSTWIIDSWPWKSFLLLGFNLQHITISLKLDRAVGWKRFQEKENDARSRNPSRSRHHTSFHLFSFFSWERIMKENNKWKRSCETIVMRAKRCLLFFFEEASSWFSLN